MTEGNALKPDDAADKRRRRLLASKRLYQRFWGGRTAGETPVAVFLGGSPDIGRGYILDAFERNFETDVYRNDDQRAFVDGRLRPEDELRRLIARSRAPAMIFAAAGDIDSIVWLLEEFLPARALWLFDDYRQFIVGARSGGDLAAARKHLRDWADNTQAGDRSGLPDALKTLANQRELDADAVWGLLWYARHAAFRHVALRCRSKIYLVSEKSLIKAPQKTINWLFEVAGIPLTDKNLPPRAVRPFRSHRPPELPDSLRQACDDLYDWLWLHSVDVTEHP